MRRFPHAFSGGQRQRIGIARALALQPAPGRRRRAGLGARRLGAGADPEPAARPAGASFGLTYLFVAHDLSVVKHISDRVAVMYVGRIVELAPTDALFARPAASLHRGAAVRGARARPAHCARERIVLQGEVADPAAPPSGCYFHPRCPYAIEVCRTQTPAGRRSRPAISPAVTARRSSSSPAWSEVDFHDAVTHVWGRDDSPCGCIVAALVPPPYIAVRGARDQLYRELTSRPAGSMLQRRGGAR